MGAPLPGLPRSRQRPELSCKPAGGSPRRCAAYTTRSVVVDGLHGNLATSDLATSDLVDTLALSAVRSPLRRGPNAHGGQMQSWDLHARFDVQAPSVLT